MPCSMPKTEACEHVPFVKQYCNPIRTFMPGQLAIIVIAIPPEALFIWMKIIGLTSKKAWEPTAVSD